MQENELYIEGQSVDLSDETIISLTYQINSIADLQNRNGNYSNIFKLPKTSRNREIFEDLDVVNSATKIPYKILKAKLIKNGFPVVPSGVSVIEGVDDSYNVRINSGNIDYFIRIEGQSVGSLFPELQQWNIQNIFDSRNNIEKWIYPFIVFAEDDVLFTGNDVNVRHSLPCLFIKTIFERSAENEGFYLSGSFFDSEILTKLILTPDSFFFPESRINYFKETFSAEIPSSGFELYGTIVATPVPALNIFDKYSSIYEITLNDGISNFNPAMFGDLELNYDFEPFINGTGASVNSIELFFYDVTASNFIQVETIISSAGIIGTPLIGTFNYYGGLIEGHEYKAGIRFRIISDTISDIDFGVNYINKFEVRFTSVKNIFFKSAIFFEDIFQIKQKDLIKDVLNQFGVLVQTSNLTNVIEYNFFSDIEKNKKIAEDWSHLVDTNFFEMVFKFGNYAKINNFKYKEADGVSLGFGDGFFELFDEKMNPIYDAVQMTTSASESVIQSGNEAPIIYNFDSGYTFTNANNRILILDKKDGVSYNWKYYEDAETETSSTNVPFCYFQQAGKDVNLTFNRSFENNLIDSNYIDLINIIDEIKVCKLYLKTNTIQVENINFMIPIYLNVQAKKVYIQGYFYINKIENFTKNLTKFELIKI